MMITEDSVRRIARVVHAFERGPRVKINAPPLRTAGDDADDAIKLGKTVSSIGRLSSGDVNVYVPPPPNDTCARSGCEAKEFSATGETICAQNLIESVAADEWVYLLKPGGGTDWHIIGRASADVDEEQEEDDCGKSVANAVKLTFTACHGTGAKAHATVAGDCKGELTGVVVDDPGSGYAILGRAEPELVISGGGGSGATFTVTYTETLGNCDIPTWSIESVAVEDGENYRDGAILTVRQQENTVLISCAKLLIQTSSGGVPVSVTVEDGGEFYKEDPSLDPYVADVSVVVDQLAPSSGSGATFTVNVDDNTASETFGQISSVTIDSPGTDYVGQVNQYATLWNHLDFTTIPGYAGENVQMLGHAAGGCLQWFDVTTCAPDTSGVCCIAGEISEHTTQAACESAGGTWKPGASADDLPGPCCP